jgi:hypothetical protein
VQVVLLALATVLAIVSKYTSVLLFPAFALVALVEACRPLRKPRAWKLSRLRKRTVQLAAAGGLALLLLNGIYLFQGSFTPASEQPWLSRGLGWLRDVPVPLLLPDAFARGLDLSALIQEQPGLGRGYNYVLGELSADGRSYAFPVMLALKVPLGVLALALLGARCWPKRAKDEVPDAVVVLVPGLVLLAFYSLVAKPQLGIRYVLPVVALLILAAAVAAASLGTRRAWLLVVALAGWSAASSLSYHPHYMSYFNELVVRRAEAWRFLADSNLDWEDRRADIERFEREHPGLDVAVDPDEPRAGYLLVSANRLVGLYDPEEFRWLREGFTPLGHVGYSYVLFHVPEERLAPALARHPPGLEPPELPRLHDPSRRR